jgi:hypothetical protein
MVEPLSRRWSDGTPLTSSSHLGGLPIGKIAHLFSWLQCDVVPLSRHLLLCTGHLKGALYRHVTAIRCEADQKLDDILKKYYPKANID